jgi:pimeloyl-ACP methyl ester carboxylesterase
MKRKLLVILLALLFVLLGVPFLIPLPDKPYLSPQKAAPKDGGRFITIDGIQTYVRDIGPRNAPAVILIHGFGGSTFSWRKTLLALADAGYRAVALDLKGFGLATKQYDGDYSHGSQATFTLGVVHSLGIERATLVGHSMGGNVAAHFALRYPERVDKLVIVDGAIISQELDGSSFLGLAGWLVRFPPIRRWARHALLRLLTPEWVSETLRMAVYWPESVTPDMVAGYLAPQTLENWDWALLGILRDAHKNALSVSLTAIAAPILIIWGEEDTWVPLSAGRRLHKALPNSELYLIPGAGHLPMEETPDAFNARLLAFLELNRPSSNAV